MKRITCIILASLLICVMLSGSAMAADDTAANEEILNANYTELCEDLLYRNKWSIQETKKYLIAFLDTMTLAGDLCRSENLNWHAVYIYGRAAERCIMFFAQEGYEELQKYYATLGNRSVAIVDSAVQMALNLGEINCAKYVLDCTTGIFFSCMHDYDTALELAAKYDAYFPPESGMPSAVSIITDRIEQYGLDKASVLSDGNLTIIVGISAAVIFGLGGFLIGRKSRLKAHE